MVQPGGHEAPVARMMGHALVFHRQREIGIVIELKYAEDGTFEAGCQEALRQIHERKYESALIKNGLHTIYRYGIACYKKRCKVVSESLEVKP